MTLDTDLIAAIAKLAFKQYGIVSRAQLLELGLSPDAILHWLKSGRLHRVYAGVYAVGCLPTSPEARMSAALMACGSRSAISHLPAAQFWGFNRWPIDQLDLITSVNKRSPEGVRLHRSRTLTHNDTTNHHGLEVTSVPRTLFDITDGLNAFQVANAIHRAAYKNLYSQADVCELLDRNRCRQNVTILRDAMQMYESGSPGTRSPAEDAFLNLVLETGLPLPLVNRVQRFSGDSFELDFFWPLIRLCVEIDGMHHGRPTSTGQDVHRDSNLASHGIQVIRIAPKDIRRKFPMVRKLIQ